MKALTIIIEAKWGNTFTINTLIKRYHHALKKKLSMLSYIASQEQHSGKTQNGILRLFNDIDLCSVSDF